LLPQPRALLLVPASSDLLLLLLLLAHGLVWMAPPLLLLLQRLLPRLAPAAQLQRRRLGRPLQQLLLPLQWRRLQQPWRCHVACVEGEGVPPIGWGSFPRSRTGSCL
jgi:hypothetical protein